MKRWIHAATEVKTYRNKRNPNKYLEVHEDGYGHRSVKPYMEWDNGVRNDLGDTNLHRWKKGNMDDLLEDYEEIESCDVTASDWEDDPNADMYVVKIWYETDSPRSGLPSAAEEVIQTVATSPQEAIEYAKRQWSGPIDRIEIVDINPTDTAEDIPFEASTDTGKHLSGCSFDFDLGGNYDAKYLDNAICDIFDEMGLYCKGTDFRAVEYPGGKLYSQCQVDFEWSGSYDDKAIEDALETLIDDEGGNFFGTDFYSLDD